MKPNGYAGSVAVDPQALSYLLRNLGKALEEWERLVRTYPVVAESPTHASMEQLRQATEWLERTPWIHAISNSTEGRD